MDSNPLNPVWKAYQVSTECFKISQEVIKQQKAELFTESNWPLQSFAQQDIREAVKESDELFVLDLWATFERFAITYLQNKGNVLQNIVPTHLANRQRLLQRTDGIYDHFFKNKIYPDFAHTTLDRIVQILLVNF